MYQNYQQNAFQNQWGSSNASSQYRGQATKYQPIGNVQSQYNPSNISSLSGQTGFQNANQYSNFQNQNPQSYHTANYRGNQQGHDAYLRSDSTQPSQSQFGSGFGNQSLTSFNNAGTSLGSQQQYGQQQFGQQQYIQQQSPESFHTANYRGNQQGHDAYLRSDSTQPSQSQFGIGATTGFSSYNTGMNISQFGANQQNQQNQQLYSQFQNPQSFHSANYRGNQQGHDTNLRSDSTQPSQSQFGGASSSFSRYQF